MHLRSDMFTYVRMHGYGQKRNSIAATTELVGARLFQRWSNERVT